MKAIVTGHSKGLGAGLAAELMARGIAVLGLSRSAVPELGARYPGLLTEVAIDLADADALGRWLAGPALRGFLGAGEGALLINNAGVVEPVGALHQQDPMAVARAVTLNVTAPMVLSAAVVAAGEGAERRIMHISSGAGRNAYPGWSVYCATKAALDHHARAVALDAVPGVRICSFAPGVIDTEMQAVIRSTPVERFPMRDRFVALQRDGQLVAASEAAPRIVDYLLSAGFGDKSTDDLRG